MAYPIEVIRMLLGWKCCVGSQGEVAVISEGVTMTDQSTIDWKIALVREDIGRDWAELASKDLNFEQRKAIREHLQMNIASLRQLVEQSGSEAVIR